MNIDKVGVCPRCGDNGVVLVAVIKIGPHTFPIPAPCQEGHDSAGRGGCLIAANLPRSKEPGGGHP